MSLLGVALPGHGDGLRINVSSGNVHISLQNPHQESDFCLHQADPDRANNNTSYSESATKAGGNKILKLFSPSARA